MWEGRVDLSLAPVAGFIAPGEEPLATAKRERAPSERRLRPTGDI